MVAAFLFAGRRVSADWQAKPVVCLSPIDLRPMLSLQRSSGVITSGHFTTLSPSESPAFWDFARAIKGSILSAQSLDAAENGHAWHTEDAGSRVRPVRSEHVPSSGPEHDLKLSNYGDPKVRTEYGALRLRGLYPSHLSGGPSAQCVSAITIDGELCVCHAAREMLPSLLGDSLALLQEACVESSQTV